MKQRTNNLARAVLADGMLIGLDSLGACTFDLGDGPLDSKVCGTVAVDVNGFKGPNRKGIDYFDFYLTTTGLYPCGAFNDGLSCDENSTTWPTSAGCTAKVLIGND